MQAPGFAEFFIMFCPNEISICLLVRGYARELAVKLKKEKGGT